MISSDSQELSDQNGAPSEEVVPEAIAPGYPGDIISRRSKHQNHHTCCTVADPIWIYPEIGYTVIPCYAMLYHGILNLWSFRF